MRKKLEKALGEMQELRKRDLDHVTRERVEKASRDLQAEYLAEASPPAFEAWRAAQERAGRTV